MSDPFEEFFRELANRGRRNGGDGPGDRARPVGPRRRGRSRAGILLAVVIVLVFAVLFVGGAVVNLATDAIWFGSIGYSSVFWTRVGAQVVLAVLGLAVALALLVGNVWLAGRFSPPPAPGGARSIRGFLDRFGEAARTSRFGDRYVPVGGETVVPEELPDITPLVTVTLYVVAVLASLVVAAAVAGSWQLILLWVHRVPYSPVPGVVVPDPVFGQDISFYLFDLPLYRLLQSVANMLLLVLLAMAAIRYAVAAMGGGAILPRPARLHLGVLGALYMLTIAAGYQLDRYEQVYSDRGVAVGVSYTDFNAVLPALQILTVVALIVGAVVLVGAALGRYRPIAIGVAAWVVAAVLLGGLYPEVVQRFVVQPNEQTLESPFITYNMAMTRKAFDLERWNEIPYSGQGTLTAAQLMTEKATFANSRLWDYRPLSATLDQLQTVRQYFDFYTVGADRYLIDGSLQQVWVSARELAPERNPQAQSWVNQRITYTHGYGAAMTPVSGVTNEGLPVLYIKNMPPVSSNGAPVITQPRVYFGIRPSSYVVVNAKQPEFDYPVGGASDTAQNATTTWKGTTGIKIDNPLTKLLYALRFGDLNLLISDQLTSDSKLLWNRSTGDRFSALAPFLAYDYDPYVVIDGQGRLKFIQDAYTLSDRFPNAQPFDTSALRQNSGLLGQSLDYLRNSVKIVMDAYDGTTTFYAADPNDPLLRAWEGIFPGLFKPLDQMPPDLRAHLRTPEDMFDVQTRTYATYHVTDPGTYYRRDDLWTVPVNPAGGQQLPVEAYYVTMRLPGEAKPEFLLLQPMVPTSRPNMIAWIGVRNDTPNYGTVRVYRFPRDTSIFGPTQIEARIDQDPTISSQITLWDQAGSTVIKGNLIVIPIQDSLLYVEPIYLQSTSSQFPEFQKVVTASTTKVVWGNTLTEALTQLVAPGGGTAPSPSQGPSPGTSPAPSQAPPASSAPSSPLPSDVRALIAYANLHFEQAQAALRAGDFARYGTEIAIVEQALRQLTALTGGTIASPAPTASPAGPTAAPPASPAP